MTFQLGHHNDTVALGSEPRTRIHKIICGVLQDKYDAIIKVTKIEDNTVMVIIRSSAPSVPIESRGLLTYTLCPPEILNKSIGLQ